MLLFDEIGVDVNIGPKQFIILKTTQDEAISESQINKRMIDGNFGNISFRRSRTTKAEVISKSLSN